MDDAAIYADVGSLFAEPSYRDQPAPLTITTSYRSNSVEVTEPYSPIMARTHSSRGRNLARHLSILPFALIAAFLVLLLPTLTGAADPGVSVTRFQHLPSKIVYFDDSPVALYHDATSGTVHRSENEGKSWNPISLPSSIVGKAAMLVPHPYDKKTSFILSRDTTHWRSSDRGKTWQEFLTPSPPATRAGPPMEFHADEKHWEWIIFTVKMFHVDAVGWTDLSRRSVLYKRCVCNQPSTVVGVRNALQLGQSDQGDGNKG